MNRRPTPRPLRVTRAAFALLFVLLAACPGCPTDPISEDPAVDYQVEVALSDAIPTVATATWTAQVSPEGSVEEGWIEFGLDTGYGLEAPATLAPDGSFSAILLGMKPSREYHYRVAGVLDGATAYGDDEVLATGLGPSELPELTVPIADPELSAGGYYVLSMLSFPAAAVIVDSDGDYVWWQLMDVAELELARAVLSRDRQYVRYMSLVEEESGDLQHALFQMELDGSSVDTMTVAQSHHDFVELPDGTLTVIAHDERTVDDETVVGDRLVEYGTDGSEVEIWSIWDYMEYQEPVNPDAGTTWSHANALDYSPEDDTYTLSVRNFDMVLTIDRAAGEVLETIGGTGSDFELVGGDAEWFHKAHQFDREGDELLVFSNGFDVQTGSQVLGYELDADAGEASMLWSYRAAFPLYCYTYGDVNRLPSGNVVVTWSTAGQMEEVTWAGDVVWQLKANLGAGFGYTTWMESLYPE